MNLYRVTGAGITDLAPAEAQGALSSDDGFVWLDVLERTDEADALLSDVFGLGELPMEMYRNLSLVPRLNMSGTDIFLTVHSLDDEGHLLEIDLFVGANHLVTVHGTHASGIPPDVVRRETNAVLAGVRAGAIKVASPLDLAFDVLAALATWLETYLGEVASRSGKLDRDVRENRTGDREEFVKALYSVRHELSTIRNRAAQTHAVCTVLAERAGDLIEGSREMFQKLAHHFGHVRDLCDGEREFLQGTLDFYESLITAKMNVAMERLALIAVLLIPLEVVTALNEAKLVGPEHTDWASIAIYSILIAGAIVAIFRYTKKRGWW